MVDGHIFNSGQQHKYLKNATLGKLNRVQEPSQSHDTDL